MNRIVKKIVDNSNQESYSASMRRRRFSLFQSLLENLARPIDILDVGGTQRFWQVMEFVDMSDIHITVLNLKKPKVTHKNFSAVAGDATQMHQFSDNQFDVVFSNSVIEHVGDLKQQRQMASEVQRVGRHYFVQTPNYFFPIEPHFLAPGFQWLPVKTRVFLIRHFNLGWVKKTPDIDEANNIVAHTRLLKKKELLSMFPGARLYEEKMFGLTKSFIVYDDGW